MILLLRQFDTRLNEPMKNHTSFKVGGNADALVLPKNDGELIDIIRICKKERVPFVVIGNGSNLLVSDDGIRGVVIKTKNMDEIQIIEDGLRVSAGVTLPRLARFCAENSLAGLEFAAGIPATVGGALYMNAGAYGGEMKDVVKNAEILRDGEIITAELEFSYRRSSLRGDIALRTNLRLERGDKAEILAKMDANNKTRREKQPQEPSAGSTFKRGEGYFAAKLIDDAELRGASVGGASVSPKHAGFIVNTGGATARDIYALMRLVAETVRQKFGITLEPEIELLGNF
ncbi:UDP-N-acetylenolpyruvoylglucosamine reductase [Clostridia bacterium]|nr:UDP-N-acetylenolpyruvoylglucosamine reductase [Clostridia bacterium]